MKRLLALAALTVAALTGCGSAARVSDTGTTSASSSGPLPCSAYTDAKPDRCLTPGQRKEQRKRAVRQRKRAAKEEAARVAAQQNADDVAAEAAAAASAWHKGYLGPDGDNHDVYGRWRTDLRCADYATNGCMHFEAITENGCRYLQISVSEMQGGAIVGSIIQNQINVPPKTPVILELDADREGITSGPPSIVCY